ncbi:MAG: DUF2065 family protein [Marinosulfonomonas sp.]|nr:DUF2065 family protein [Marinosulfonomonas sp.]
MIEAILLALGLVLVLEGLVYALAPSLVEALLLALKDMPLDTRRRIGLIAVALGVGLIWLARVFG